MVFRLWTRVAAAAALACAQDLACVRTPAAYVERLDATGYQRLDRPSVANSGVNAAPPDDVSLTFDLDYLLDVEQLNQRLQLQGTLGAYWTDGRLKFNESCAGTAEMQFPFSVAAMLWAPSPYISNEVASGRQVDFKQSLIIASDGGVSLTTRRKLLTKCKMDFHKLPYDTQHCDVYFALNEAQNDVVIVAKPGFELCGNHSFESNQPAGNSKWKLKALSQKITPTALTMSLTLERKYKYYEAYVIVPAILLVIISYSSSFITRTNAVRVTLAVISLLTLINFNAQQMARIPNVAYHVRLLSFLYLSMFFCAAAIFEYVLINILLRTEQKIQAALDAAHKDLGITSLEEQRSVHKEIKRLRKRKGSGSNEGVVPEVETTPRTPRAVRRNGTDMWMKDQYLDILFRWLYLPLYILFASFSLNF